MMLGRFVFFARFSPYSTRRLEYTGVSEEFIYFGSDLSSTRLPKATTSPRVSMTGSMRRLRNLSYRPPFLFCTTRPACSSSDLV